MGKKKVFLWQRKLEENFCVFYYLFRDSLFFVLIICKLLINYLINYGKNWEQIVKKKRLFGKES